MACTSCSGTPVVSCAFHLAPFNSFPYNEFHRKCRLRRCSLSSSQRCAGVSSESLRSLFGVSSESLRSLFGVSSESLRSLFGVSSESLRSLFGVSSESLRSTILLFCPLMSAFYNISAIAIRIIVVCWFSNKYIVCCCLSI